MENDAQFGAKKWAGYLAAPAAVFFLLSVVFIRYGQFPFGSQTAAWCDAYQQVIPFLMDARDILLGNDGMFLNLHSGAGMNFWGVFLFFVSSPFTLLSVLVPKSELYLFFNILLLLKMMLCAGTAAFFFRRSFPQLGILQNTALAVMYAFCGYTMFYFQNLVWLDMMALFPVLLVSLHALFRQRRILPYVLTLSAMIAIHFYLAFMVVLFLVLAFGVYNTIAAEKKERRKNILLLGLSTGAAAALTAAVWVPAFLQYIDSARTGMLAQSLRESEFFTKFHTTGSLVLCTALLLAAVPFLYTIRNRGRGLAGSIFIFLLTFLPVVIEPINKMWHGGSYQAFPLRYSFIPLLFGLILCAAVLDNENSKPPVQQSHLGGILLGLLPCAAAFAVSSILLKNRYEEITVYTRTLWEDAVSFTYLFGFAAVAAMGYFLLLLLYRYRYLGKTAFSLLLCALLGVECVFHGDVFVGSASEPIDGYRAVMDIQGKISDSSLYRVKTEKKYFDANLLGGMGYGSLAHYSSLTSRDYLTAMKKLGYSSYWMEVNSNGGTILTDAILGNRYTVSQLEDLTNAQQVYNNGVYAITRNPFDMGFGFLTEEGILNARTLPEDGTRFAVQEKVFEALFPGNERLVTEYPMERLGNIIHTKDTYRFEDTSETGTITWNIRVEGTQALYFDCFNKITNRLEEPVNNSLTLYINNRLMKTEYPTKDENGLLYLGTFSNEDVTVLAELERPIQARSLGVAGLDVAVLREAQEQAVTKEATGSVNLRRQGNSLIGTINAAEGGYLFVPVSGAASCEAVVNQKETEAVSVLDTFLAVKLDAGDNTVFLTFTAPGFRAGAAWSVAGFVLLVVLLDALRRGWYRYLSVLERPAWAVFSLLWAGVFAVVYLLPIIIYFT